MALTTEEQQFVTEFIKDLNPVLACERIGYDESLAPAVAYEMLGKEHVKDAMARALSVSQHYEQVVEKFNPRDFGVTENYIALRLKSIADRSTRTGDQLRALELLGKTIGLFKDTADKAGNGRGFNAFDPKVRKQLFDKVKQSRLKAQGMKS